MAMAKQRWDTQEPMLLVGSCNNWNVEQASRRHQLKRFSQNDGTVESRVVVAVSNSQPLDFQIISAKSYWSWRLHPPGDSRVSDFGVLASTRSTATAALLAEGTFSETAHGRNFRLRPGTVGSVTIHVVLSEARDINIWFSNADLHGAVPSASPATKKAAGAVPSASPATTKVTKTSAPKGAAKALGPKSSSVALPAPPSADTRASSKKTPEFGKAQALSMQADFIEMFEEDELSKALVNARSRYRWRSHFPELTRELDSLLEERFRSVMKKHGVGSFGKGFAILLHKAQVAMAPFMSDRQVALDADKLMRLWSRVDTEKNGRGELQELLPLRMVGGFCNWELEVEGLEFDECGFDECTITVEVQSSPIEFQLVSSTEGFKWRLFPKATSSSALERGKTSTNVEIGGEQDGHGLNFKLEEAAGTIIAINVAFSLNPDPVVGITYRSLAPKSDRKVTIGSAGVRAHGSSTSWSSDPRKCTIEQIGPLRIIGNCSTWGLQTKGLTFDAARTNASGWREYSICFRMLSHQIDFQIVSSKVGFKWRVFPEEGDDGGLLPKSPESKEALLGGASDGHMKNFRVREKVLSIIKLFVWLEEVKTSASKFSPTVGKIELAYEMSVSKPQVNIGEHRVQFPPKPLHAFSPEVLTFASSTEEKERVLEERRSICTKASWLLQEAYSSDAVQEEILALRELYPHRVRRDLLALEQGTKAQKTQGPKLQLKDGHAESDYTGSEKPSRGQEKSASENTGDNANKSTDATNGVKEPTSPTPSAASTESMYPASSTASGIPSTRGPPSAVDADDKSSNEALNWVQEQIQVYSAENAMVQTEVASVRKLHVQHLRQQEKCLKIYEQSGEVPHGLDRYFGSLDAQFIMLLQGLPCLQVARAEVMNKIHIPVDMYSSVLKMCEDINTTNVSIYEANALCGVRQRIFPVPHPKTLKDAAQSVMDKGFFLGTPKQFYHALDTSIFADWLDQRSAADTLWGKGYFKNWFGGPKAGRYMVTSVEQLFDWQALSLCYFVVVLQDQLRLFISAMGEHGKDLRVERRVLVSYHASGDQLPPWQDAAGMKSRRLTMNFHLSIGHTKISDGGSLRLHQLNNQDKGSRPSGPVGELPAGGGHWSIFYTHKFKQEVAKVHLPCGRWCITVCAEDSKVAEKLRPPSAKSSGPQKSLATAVVREEEDNFDEQKILCDRCQFSAGDGVQLSCKHGHHLCRECIQREIRAIPVPTCPVCAGEDDRVFVSAKFDLFASPSLDDLGCVCSQDEMDPGSRVLIFGFSKAAKLNGKLAELVWWNQGKSLWDVYVFATKQIVSVSTHNIQLVECCPAGSGGLHKCPCWPSGRGIYPVSLGNRCCTKLGIDECTGPIGANSGYPYFHGTEYMPFDSILTKIEAVLYFLRHNFANFLHYNDMIPVRPENCPHVTFDTYRSTIHAFPHHHPQKDGSKLQRRIERFRVLCRHSRDVRGSRTLVFVRFVGDSAEFERVEELYSLLRLWAGPRVRLVYVSMEQTTSGPRTSPYLLRHAQHPRILFWMVGKVGVMDFSPIREALRLAVLDEAGVLRNVEEAYTWELLKLVRPFKDPYTQGWLNPLQGRDPAFFPCCDKAQCEGQGDVNNSKLLSAVRDCQMHEVSKLLLLHNGMPTGLDIVADPNTWDRFGRTPMHYLANLEKRGFSTIQVVKMAGSLLLSHGDPQCHDKAGVTASQMVQQNKGSSNELQALLRAGTADKEVDRAALYKSLEMLGEPFRSRLALMFDLGGIRAIGEAEFAWRNPPPGIEDVIAVVEEEVRAMERMSEEMRKKTMKRLLLEWHPDKNAERLELATIVFQYLQTRKHAIITK